MLGAVGVSEDPQFYPHEGRHHGSRSKCEGRRFGSSRGLLRMVDSRTTRELTPEERMTFYADVPIRHSNPDPRLLYQSRSTRDRATDCCSERERQLRAADEALARHPA